MKMGEIFFLAGLGAATIAATLSSSAAFAADISPDSLKFASGVVKAPAYETPATNYIVANATNVYSDHAFSDTKVMGELKRGDPVDVLAKVKGWEWVLVGSRPGLNASCWRPTRKDTASACLYGSRLARVTPRILTPAQRSCISSTVSYGLTGGSLFRATTTTAHPERATRVSGARQAAPAFSSPAPKILFAEEPRMARYTAITARVALRGAGDECVWSETGCTCVLVTSTKDILR